MRTSLVRIARPDGLVLFGVCRSRDLFDTAIKASREGFSVRCVPWKLMPRIEGMVSEEKLAAACAEASPRAMRVITLGIAQGRDWVEWELPGDPPAVPRT
jgi:hypothetical protein